MMLCTRYPLSTSGGLRGEIDRMFGDAWDGLRVFAAPRTGAAPALNVWEDGDCVYAEAEVPGLGRDDVDIHVAGNELTIKGQRGSTTDEDLNYHRRERCVGTFERRLILPFDVNLDAVEATLKDGLLTIKLPKAESAKVRQIPVTAE